jgi:hypothetical protein
MLYNPKWEVKAEPFSLDSLIAWLEKQPADKEYNWSLAGSCLLGQWCEARGLLGGELFNKSLELGQWSNGNDVFAEVALGNLSECTFGAALKRARALSRT